MCKLKNATDNEIAIAALSTYGIRAQEEVAIEEMAELTKAIVKRWRGKKGADDQVVEEIADVGIMLMQLSAYWGEGRVSEAFTVKINRLKDRLAALDPDKDQVSMFEGDQ